MGKNLWLWAGALALFAVSTASAEVTLPNGQSIPRDSNNGETQLYTLFSNRGEAIDWIADGFPTPNTFSPLCSFKATFLLKQSGSSLGVGWYNVDPNATAAPTEIIQVVAPGTPVGTVLDATDIRTHPSYAGGLIGFALIRTPYHFTEAKWNTKCTSNACATAGYANQPWILSVSYRSLNTPNAYYVAFEDGNTSASEFGNDGDYNDYVFLFEGLVCAGDGAPCEVEGAQGECKPGITECNNTGTLVCKSFVSPQDERCDGLDNDCDGDVDEGEGLCAPGEVCTRGACLPSCEQAEFACGVLPLTLCEDGVCIDPRCQGKTCDVGKVCVAGDCRAPCDDVICPVGRSCRAGVCVDPCAGVTCSEQRICVDGACVLDCACSGCGSALVCDADQGLCVAEGCEGKICGAGQFCSATGACADSCENASCPAGTRCAVGECVPVAGGADAGAGDGDGYGNGDGDGNDVGDAGTGGAGGNGGSGASKSDSSGCSCRVGASPDQDLRNLLVWSLMACALVWRNRRAGLRSRAPRG